MDKRKGHCETDQDIHNDLAKPVNIIVSPNTDIDNGQIYDISTGDTIMDLEDIICINY